MENLRNFYVLYDEICTELKRDTELNEVFSSLLTEDCYADTQLRTLTIDVGFFISRHYKPKDNDLNSDEWFPSNYSPGFSVEEWIELLNNSDVFTDSALEVMKRIKDHGGQATCKKLEVEYGKSANFIIQLQVSLQNA